jgi:trk system potassium uptake protein TrkA
MQIIIVGCGKVGIALTAQLSNEQHNITVIDQDAAIVNTVSTNYDVLGINGNGSSYNTLMEAGIEQTDILIAVTNSDELNLLCCVIAKKAGNCKTIARVRNPIFNQELDFIRKELAISMIINPELAASVTIARLLRFPTAIEIDTFAKGRVEILSFKVPAESKLTGMALRELSSRFHCDLLICAVEREGTLVIPDGNFIIQQGDILSMIVTPENAGAFFKHIGIRTNQVKSVILVGGGGITYYLTHQLLANNIDVKIIEKNLRRCEELSELFPKATIIHADGSDRDVLEEEQIDESDAFVALTDIDEENIMLSLFARDQVKSKVITKVNRVNFTDVIHTLNLDSVIYPKHITAELILRYVRAAQNSIGSNVETLHRLMDDRVEALEFIIQPTLRIINTPLRKLELKENLLVACINRKGHIRIPGGDDCFMVGDTVIVVTTLSGLQDINDILKG